MASKWPFLMSLPLGSWLLIQFVCGTVSEQHLTARKKKTKSCNLLVDFLWRSGGTDHNEVLQKNKASCYLSPHFLTQTRRKRSRM